MPVLNISVSHLMRLLLLFVCVPEPRDLYSKFDQRPADAVMPCDLGGCLPVLDVTL